MNAAANAPQHHHDDHINNNGRDDDNHQDDHDDHDDHSTLAHLQVGNGRGVCSGWLPRLRDSSASALSYACKRTLDPAFACAKLKAHRSCRL